jgi:hypothetical protein
MRAFTPNNEEAEEGRRGDDDDAPKVGSSFEQHTVAPCGSAYVDLSQQPEYLVELCGFDLAPRIRRRV